MLVHFVYYVQSMVFSLNYYTFLLQNFAAESLVQINMNYHF